MPVRMLRDWTDSPKLEGLSCEAERLFVRLLMKADDYGRFHAHPKLVKAACFPLSEDLRANTVAAWITELIDRHLVFGYTSGGREYLAIVKFGQRFRASKARFPAPDGMPDQWMPDDGAEPAGAADCDGAPPAAASRGEAGQAAATRGNSPQVAAGDGDGDGDEDGGGGESRVCATRAAAAPALEVADSAGVAEALESLRALRPEYSRVSEAAFLNAWKIEKDRTLRARAFSEALAALAGKLETDRDPLKLIRGYLRNARRMAQAGAQEARSYADDEVIR